MEASRMIIKTILFFFITLGYGYNVDIDFPIIYSNENMLKNSNSYFGYTVHLYHEPDNNVSWLIVGAPRGNYTLSVKQKLNYPKEPGVAYRYVINDKIRREIKPEEIGTKKIYIEQLKMNMLMTKEYGWFGSTISIDELNGMLIVCAPRTIIRFFPSFSNTYINSLHGMCYGGKVAWNALLTETNFKLYDFASKFWYNPMHGFSAHCASMKQNADKKEKGINYIIGKPNHEIYGTVDIVQSRKKVSVELPLNDNAPYFGYSVVSGYFFEKNQLLYVSGAPRWQYIGQVAIINPAIDSPIIMELHGNEIGEYFGASLAVGDLNNDGLDDLLVGAPYWGQDNGKVYIYFGSEKKQFGTVVYLQGATEGGYFGYAITSGDLDADGFDDIIVGAPWEKSGVIYIYNGDSDLKDKKLQPSQRIEAINLSLPNNLRKVERFGFSISKPVDIDENGYLDIAVGAYKSEHAIVFYSKPVVRTELTIQTIPKFLERDTRYFLIEICSRYDGYNVQNMQAMDYKIIVTVDKQYQRTKKTFFELRSSNLTSCACLNTQVNVSKSVRDFIEPISIFAKHEFVYNNVSDHFCKLCPIEKKYNKLNTAHILLPFNIGCGTDKVCNSNISAITKFHGVRDNNTWVIGSNDISLEIYLKNYGEPAYLTQLEFMFPEGIILRSILPFCQENTFNKNLIVVCDVGNPLWEKEEKNVKLDLDMKYLVYDFLCNYQLNFHITIKTRNTNQGTTNITKSLNLLCEVSLSLNGKANEEIYYLSTMNNVSNVTFQHTYQVYKLGATPIEDSQLIIKVPKAIKNSEPLVHLSKPQLYVSGEVFECSIKDIPLYTEQINLQDPFVDEFERELFSINIHQNESYVIRARDINESSIEFYDMGNIKAPQITNDILTNGTIYMNCSVPDVNCITIVCSLNTLKTLQDIGKVPIKLFLNIDKLKDTFVDNTVILKFGTEASVEILKPAARIPINGIRSTMEIITVFHNIPKMKKLQLWIIFVSVLVGLMLLFIFVAILSKLGFFKRKGTQDFTNDEKTENFTAATKHEGK